VLANPFIHKVVEVFLGGGWIALSVAAVASYLWEKYNKRASDPNPGLASAASPRVPPAASGLLAVDQEFGERPVSGSRTTWRSVQPSTKARNSTDS
jgi:hypothetical protein